MDKKQTAVEWLVNKLFDASGVPVTEKNNPKLFELINQAKEMEKEQIEKAYNESWRLRDKPYLTALKYYNETYGN
jgi:hypothetical protein